MKPIPIGLDLHTYRGMTYDDMKHMAGGGHTNGMILFDGMTRGMNKERSAADLGLSCIPHEHHAKMSQKRTFAEYSHHMRGISPPGNGLDCHRTWELIFLGVVPIVKKGILDALYSKLPHGTVQIVRDWKDACDNWTLTVPDAHVLDMRWWIPLNIHVSAKLPAKPAQVQILRHAGWKSTDTFGTVNIHIAIPIHERFGYAQTALRSIRESGETHVHIYGHQSAEEMSHIIPSGLNYTLLDVGSTHDVNQHSRDILKDFLKSNKDYLFFLDSDLVVVPTWRSVLNRLHAVHDDIVSLYNSAFHKLSRCDGGICWKKSVGNAGVVMSRTFVTDLITHSKGLFDWDYVGKRGSKQFVVPYWSAVEHIGHFGAWNNNCKRNKVEHAVRFALDEVSPWVRGRIKAFTKDCIKSHVLAPSWTIGYTTRDIRRSNNAIRIANITGGKTVKTMTAQQCRLFLDTHGIRWTGKRKFLIGKLLHWCNVLQWLRSCFGRCILVQDDTILRENDIDMIRTVAQAPLQAALTTMTTDCTECVMITNMVHAKKLLDSVRSTGVYHPTDWQLKNRVLARGIGKRHAGWPSMILSQGMSTWDTFGVVSAKPAQVQMAAEWNSTVYVLTRRDAFKRRALIRSTWAKGHDVVFMVGRACEIPPSKRRKWTCELKLGLTLDRSWREEEIDKRIDSESDVVRLPMVDVYRALPRKVQASLGWLLKHRPGSKWFHKADDDMFVNVDALNKLVGTHDERENIVLGSIQKGWKVGRQPGKWQELKYKAKTWPPFPLGCAGHTVTRRVAEYVQGMTEMYQGEDVCMGIWLKGVARFVNSDKYRNDRKCPSEAVSVGHDLTDSDLKRCARVIMQMAKPTAKLTEAAHCSHYSGSQVMWGAFSDMVSTLNSLHAPYTIFGGTVLNWYRSCTLGSSDIDFALDWFWMNSNLDELHRTLRKRGWSSGNTFATPSAIGYEEAWHYQGVKIDLFSLVPVGDTHRHIWGLTTQGHTHRCTSTAQKREEQWNGIKIWVPYPVETFLSRQYGSTWRHPDPTYTWNISPFNTANGQQRCVKVQTCCLSTSKRCTWTSTIPECEKQNLLLLLRVAAKQLASVRWYITAGTLLGAVRNKSHIPDETDINIAVHESDWGRLASIDELHTTSYPYRLFLSRANRVHINFWKVIIKGDMAYEHGIALPVSLLFPTKVCEYEHNFYPCPRNSRKWVEMQNVSRGGVDIL
tara:strand:+ start:417 stop:4046 length:3630 start_codon:yes stop_codon:yes gene_type:complete